MSRTVVDAVIHARLIDPASGYEGPGGLLHRDGLILEAGPKVRPPKDARILDARERALIPGLIDLRAVVGEPGAEHKETIRSAGRAALAGGVTTFVMQPNTDPVIDDVSLVDFVLRRAPARTKARVLPAAALTRGLEGLHMTEMGLLREAGAVMFSNGDRAVADSLVLRRALSYSTAFDALVAHRPEDPSLARGGLAHEGPIAARMGLAGVPAAAELIGALRDLALADLTGARLLLDMISTAAVLEPLALAKARGARVAASVSINHLALNDLEVADYRTFAKLAPPLRTEEDRAALLDAVVSGLIDVIVSGHDPRPAEDKRLTFDEAAFGAVGLELMLPAAITLAETFDAPFSALLAAMTVRPADLLGLPQGRLAPGAPADFAIVDLHAPFRLDALSLLSKSKNTPFDGRLLQGRVWRTVVAGETVFEAAGETG